MLPCNKRTNETVRDLSTHFGLYVLQIGQKVVLLVHCGSRRGCCVFAVGRRANRRDALVSLSRAHKKQDKKVATTGFNSQLCSSELCQRSDGTVTHHCSTNRPPIETPDQWWDCLMTVRSLDTPPPPERSVLWNQTPDRWAQLPGFLVSRGINVSLAALGLQLSSKRLPVRTAWMSATRGCCVY